MGTAFDIDSHLVLKVLTGSRAHGTALPGADEDLRGVIIPPKRYWLGLEAFEQFEDVGPDRDIVYYDLRKFLALAMKGNPSVYAIFAGPKLAVIEPFASQVLALWPLCISKRLVAAHIGMAQAHLARIHAPGKNCGIKGREALAKHGYNTKDAGHVIRVLEQCIEMLATGRMVFPRPNAAELVSIKRGEWPVQRVMERAEALTAEIRSLEATTNLPAEPQTQRISSELVRIVEPWIAEHP